MSDELDDVVVEAARQYRRADSVPRDEIWTRLEHKLASAQKSAPRAARMHAAGVWRRIAAASILLAAGALLGIAGERFLQSISARRGTPVQAAVNSAAVSSYLASSDSLIRVFTLAAHGGRIRADLEPWARELIGRTRVLEQSAPASDSTLRLLLRDLDLVLVQIAQYAGQPAASASEALLIEDAIAARKLNDNLQSVARRATAGS